MRVCARRLRSSHCPWNLRGACEHGVFQHDKIPTDAHIPPPNECRASDAIGKITFLHYIWDGLNTLSVSALVSLATQTVVTHCLLRDAVARALSFDSKTRRPCCFQ